MSCSEKVKVNCLTLWINVKGFILSVVLNCATLQLSAIKECAGS